MFASALPNTGGEPKDFRMEGIAKAKAMRTEPLQAAEMAIGDSEDHMMSSFAPASIDYNYR